MNDQYQIVAKLSQIPDGDLHAVTAPDGAEVVLVRLGDDVFAIEAVCSHQEAWLDGGWVHAESLEVECPLHGGRFHLQTGEPAAPPVSAPIKTYPVRIEGEDVLIGPAN